jgi:hypothetical protein
VTDLIRPGRNVPEGLPYGKKRDARAIINKVKLDGLELQGDAALTALGMELLSGLNQERHTIARNDPELDALLCQYLMGFAQSSQQKIRTRNSPFGSL